MNRRCLNCMNIFQIPAGYENEEMCCPFCAFVEGTQPKEMFHLYPGVILQNRYIIGTVLGFGGFGITYKAWDQTLGMVVAVKEYYPTGLVQRVPGDKNVIIYEGNRRKEYFVGLSRFLDEAKNMAKFYSNPNIVHVENFFESNNTAYIVMEFLDGISLKDYLKQEGGKIDFDFAVEVASSILDALRDIHSEGILHRDISPDNIFLCEGGTVKLIDFGAARFSDEEKEVTRSIILKPGFAPPEQYQSKSKQGPWTDIYALAATIYRCITGVLPDESVNRVVEDVVLPPNHIDNSIPEYLSTSIMKGMALNQDMRFRNVDDFKKAILNQKKVVDINVELRNRKRKRVIGIAAAVILLAVSGFGVFGVYKNKKKEVVLDPATVTIWVSVGENETTDEKIQMVNDMAEKFLEEQSNVSIEVYAFPEEEYSAKLDNVAGTDEMPDLFESDNASDRILDASEELDEVYNYIDKSEYYFLGEYEKEISEGKQMPMGFNVPVVYVRRNNDMDISTVEITNFSQIRGDNGDSYYVSPQYYQMVVQSLGGNIEFDEKLSIDQSGIDMLELMTEDLSKLGLKAEDDEPAMEKFKEGEIIYYVASLNEFRIFNSEVVGLYEMRPITTDSIAGEFTDMWSISSMGSEDEIRASKVLLSYMLAEGPQKIMHITNKNAVPLNKSAYEQFIINNGKYEILNSYVDNLFFLPDEQRDIDESFSKHIKNVIEGNETISGWLNSQ
ncbi:MAG: protein kinase [Wujia sp.]